MTLKLVSNATPKTDTAPVNELELSLEYFDPWPEPSLRAVAEAFSSPSQWADHVEAIRRATEVLGTSRAKLVDAARKLRAMPEGESGSPLDQSVDELTQCVTTFRALADMLEAARLRMAIARAAAKFRPRRYDNAAAGHRLRVTRLALGLTEAEAAEAYGVTLRTYRRYEAGAKQRSGSGWLNFADTYGVSIDWLCSGEGVRNGKALRSGKVAILHALGPQHRHYARKRNDLLRDGGGSGSAA